MSAGKQVLVFLLMGGALSLFYSACGLLWRALGAKRAVRWVLDGLFALGAVLLWFILSLWSGQGGVRAYILWPMALSFWAMEPAFRWLSGKVWKVGARLSRWGRRFGRGKFTKKPGKQKKSLERRNQSSV
ncbi:MAG TPA: hypothetical protein H9691_02570 [Firmicutes bacterium]|nr:hypothetical protein [Bacillota bacterium]